MSEGKMLREMPTDIILNIQSFLLGEPDYLKIKHSNALKILQRKYLKRIYKTPHNFMNVGGFPSWRWYVQPPRFTTDRRIITHYLKNQDQQLKSLLDNPDYYNDGGILLEVEFKNMAGYIRRHRIITSEDKIETVMTSICNDYIKTCELGLDDREYSSKHFEIHLHTSKEMVGTVKRKKRRNQ